MKFQFPQFTHCIDTSAIIDIKRRQYPPDVFSSLSDNLDKLIMGGGLIAPKEVLKELGNIDDEILKWAKSHKKLFKDCDPTQLQFVQEIMNKFPALVEINKTTPAADPFIIALARMEGASVITSERNGGAGRPRIPDVCLHYGVECISVLDFFRAQGWKF